MSSRKNVEVRNESASAVERKRVTQTWSKSKQGPDERRKIMYLKVTMWKIIANIQGNSEREASSPLKILSELDMPHFRLLIKLKFLWALTSSKLLNAGKFVILESITGAVVCTLGATVETFIAADIPADAPSGQQTSCWFFYEYSEYFHVRIRLLTYVSTAAMF